MISAFAKGAQILNEPRYLEAAQRAANFILTQMYDAEYRRTCCAAIATAMLPSLDSSTTTRSSSAPFSIFTKPISTLDHMETAMRLTDKMRELFEDATDGAFFSTAAGDSSLVLRMKDDYDGAEPSGNAVALVDLLRLAHFTDRADYREAAERTLRALGPEDHSAGRRGAANAGRPRLRARPPPLKW